MKMSEKTKEYCVEEEEEYLECERWHVFMILMGVAGFFGAFTYSIRGGIFCNAQTANFVLFAMALGNGQWFHALYFLIPMSAYFAGAVLSEVLPIGVKRFNFIRWDTLFILIEMIVVVILGLLPEKAPVQISQVAINFICSMQYNTFRQARGIPMATTFCTNHWRQVAIALTKAIRHRDREKLKRMARHAAMLSVFVVGGVISTVLCRYFMGRAIFAVLIPLAILFADLLYADLKTERGELEKVPRGH
jgi:uncharacterized membrane protein YoaK (UPF0700 family)